MNFKDFGKYNQFKEQFANMPPELKEQMMKMAKERMQAKVREFFKKWFSLPALTGIAILLGAFVGALMALFGRVLLAAGDLRSTYPLYFIPALALVGAGIVFAYRRYLESFSLVEKSRHTNHSLLFTSRLPRYHRQNHRPRGNL